MTSARKNWISTAAPVLRANSRCVAFKTTASVLGHCWLLAVDGEWRRRGTKLRVTHPQKSIQSHCFPIKKVAVDCASSIKTENEWNDGNARETCACASAAAEACEMVRFESPVDFTLLSTADCVCSSSLSPFYLSMMLAANWFEI